jgi:hypothetical protein
MPITATIVLAAALTAGPIYPQQWACVKECVQHPADPDAVNAWLQIAPYDKLARKPNIEVGIKITFGGKHK